MRDLLNVADIQQAYKEAGKANSKVYILKDNMNNLFLMIGNNVGDIDGGCKRVIYIITPKKFYTVLDLQNNIFYKLFENNINFDHKLNDDLFGLLKVLARANLSL